MKGLRLEVGFSNPKVQKCGSRKEEDKSWKLWNVLKQMFKTSGPHPTLDLRSMLGKYCTINRRCGFIMQKRMGESS